MTAHQITAALMLPRYRRNFCLPRYTPSKWFECDVFELTPAGMFREYEVKLTRADFRADVKKRREELVPVVGPNPDRPWATHEWSHGRTKHEKLAERDTNGPSRFWFVTPGGLVTPQDVPEWAGLIEFTERQYGPVGALSEYEVVKAPTLHRQPLSAAVAVHARGIPYYRMHDLLARRSPVAIATESEATV